MIRYSYFLLIPLFIFLQCTQQPIGITDDSTNQQGQMLFKLNMTGAPQNVVSLKGNLSRTGYDTVFFPFILEDGFATAQIKDLSVGWWRLQVDAFNTDNMIIYSGNTMVQVQPGTNTPVYLQLIPTTGGLEIKVTWGEEVRGGMLLMAQDSTQTWHIVTMDLNGNNFLDLGQDCIRFGWKKIDLKSIICPIFIPYPFLISQQILAR